MSLTRGMLEGGPHEENMKMPGERKGLSTVVPHQEAAQNCLGGYCYTPPDSWFQAA